MAAPMMSEDCTTPARRSLPARWLLRVSDMFAGLPTMRATSAGLRSRKSMLETLVRHLDMVRLTVPAMLMALVVATGCTGLIDDSTDPGGLTPEQAAARKSWNEGAQPMLAAACASCHGGSMANIEFLQGADATAQRETLLAYPRALINLEAPQSSQILTKGLHSGPALLADQASAVLEWVQLEKAAAGSTGEEEPILMTAQFAPQICTGGLPGTATCPYNDIGLDDVGATGAKIRFVALALGSGLYLNNLRLNPGTGGAYIEHPLFVSYPDGKEPVADPIDRFFAVKMNLLGTVAADSPETQIAGGTAAFVGFVATDKIAIHFKLAGPHKAEGMEPMPTVGCKKADTFEANARAVLNTNCGSCHRGQNPNATSALDLTGVDAPNAATPNNACNQTLLRVNTIDLNQSGIYLATVPGNMNHPFAFPNQGAQDAFKNAVNVWINAEKVAP